MPEDEKKKTKTQSVKVSSGQKGSVKPEKMVIRSGQPVSLSSHSVGSSQARSPKMESEISLPVIQIPREVETAFRTFTEDPLSFAFEQHWGAETITRGFQSFQEWWGVAAKRFALPRSARELLERLRTTEVSVQELRRVMERNPWLEEKLRIFAQTRGVDAESRDLGNLIVSLGVKPTRDQWLIEGIFRPTSPSGRELNPKEVLKFAQRAEDFFGSERMGVSELAYEAGLIFDLLCDVSELGRGTPDAKKKFQTYAAQVFLHSLKTVTAALELAPQMGLKQYAKAVFQAAFLKDTGKLVLWLTEKEYARFTEWTREKSPPRLVRHLAERSRFGWTHAEASFSVVRAWGVDPLAERAILAHHQVFTELKATQVSDRIAALVAFASNMASHFRKVDRADHPIVREWITEELKDVDFPKKAILELVKRLSF